MDCSLPGSSVHGDSPGKNTGVDCMPSSRGSSQPRDQTQVSHTAGGFFITWATSTRKPHNIVIIIQRFHESKCSAHFLAEIKLLQTLTVTGRMAPSRESPGYRQLLLSYCHGVNWAGQSAALETDMYSISPGPCHQGNSFYLKDTDKHRNLSSACRHLRSVFAEISLESLSVHITCHPYSLTTICLTPCHGSSFVLSSDLGAYTTQKCPEGLCQDYLMTITWLTAAGTLCGVGGTWLKFTYSILEK